MDHPSFQAKCTKKVLYCSTRQEKTDTRCAPRPASSSPTKKPSLPHSTFALSKTSLTTISSKSKNRGGVDPVERYGRAMISLLAEVVPMLRKEQDIMA